MHIIFYLATLLLLPFSTEALKPFIMCDLHGQLGNQMFMIATTVSLARDHNAIPLFPNLNDEKNNLKSNFEAVFFRLNAKYPFRPIEEHYTDLSLIYKPIPFTPNMRIYGYFQSEKYFLHHREYILKLFEPSQAIMDYLKTHYSDILGDPKTVSIHVRTYFKEDPNHRIYIFNGRSYLRKAIMRFPADSHFVVFSDDIPWCRDNLSDLASNMRFIQGESYIHDFFLQSLCKHHIISNSSFSWWSAWLNDNPDKIVIAPKKWFTKRSGLDSKDIVPRSWITVGK